MSFLALENKTFFITGVANKKSVAYFTAQDLINNGAKIVLSVQSETQFEQVKKLFPTSDIYICNVEDENSIRRLQADLTKKEYKFSGMLHSIAFANFSEGPKPFHETKVADFLQATNISCFSLVALSNALKELFCEDASVVTVSISSTKATSYGYLGPIKATLDTTVSYLAKSFSEFSKIRFNAVCSGPLKTSASAGIPDYIENYLFAELLTMRKSALKTSEVSNTIIFLLSPASSGINAGNIIIDAGMSSNYFDQKVVKTLASSL